MLDRTSKPMTCAELAERLGVTVETFYRNRGDLHAHDGLPAPLSRHRPWRWHRPTIEAWLARFHPCAPPRAANDPTAQLALDESAIAAWQTELHQDAAARRVTNGSSKR